MRETAKFVIQLVLAPKAVPALRTDTVGQQWFRGTVFEDLLGMSSEMTIQETGPQE